MFLWKNEKEKKKASKFVKLGAPFFSTLSISKVEVDSRVQYNAMKHIVFRPLLNEV